MFTPVMTDAQRQYLRTLLRDLALAEGQAFGKQVIARAVLEDYVVGTWGEQFWSSTSIPALRSLCSM